MITSKDIAQIQALPPTTQYLFFHGKESSPHGKKYQELKKVKRKIKSPDFRELSLEQRLKKAEILTQNLKDVIIVGSSLGGLMAAILYSRYPQRIQNILLLAPAFQREAAQEIQSLPAGAIVIHGIHDETVPLEKVKHFCKRFEISVQEVDDDHRLINSLALIKTQFRQLIELKIES